MAPRRRDRPMVRAQNPVAGYVVVLDEEHATSVLLEDGTFVTVGRLFLAGSAPRPPVWVFQTRAAADAHAAGWPPGSRPIGVMAVGQDGGLWRLRAPATTQED